MLLVEDETKLRELLRLYFEREGFAVLSAASGSEAIALARKGHPDLVILDLGLPDVPGEEVAHEIRSFSGVRILILSAKTSAQDRIRGLELGVDDYMTKPFSPRELVLRSQALLRRGPSTAVSYRRRSYGKGRLIIDEEQRRVRVDDETVDLTPTEWGLLLAFTTSPGRVYSRHELMNRTRGNEYNGYDRTVDSHIKNLRRKIEGDPKSARIIETVLGGGYRISLPLDAESPGP